MIRLLALLLLALPAWAQNHAQQDTSSAAAAAEATAALRFILTPEQRACADVIKTELAKRTITLKKPAYVYHWFKNFVSDKDLHADPYASDYQDQIRAIAKRKAARFWVPLKKDETARNWNKADNMVGAGIYAATDPISTSSYGDTGRGTGQAIRIRLTAGTKFINFIRRNNYRSFTVTSPPCTTSYMDLQMPDNLDAYRVAFQELGLSGVAYHYESQRIDERNNSDHAPDSMAFMLMDEQVLSADAVTGIPIDKIFNDIPPSAEDLPESLYEKATREAKFNSARERLPTKGLKLDNPPPSHKNADLHLESWMQVGLKKWAHEYIIPMNPISDFFDLPKEKLPEKKK